jgi:hypothetical protein
VPDLGFFAAPGPAAPPLAPSPPPATAAFHEPAVFQAPGPFGTVPPSAPPPYVHPYAAPARGGLPGWAIALICAGGSVVVLMIVAAVALPVFLHQGDVAVAKATTLSPAAQVGDLTQSTDPRVLQVTDQLTAAWSTCGCLQPPVGMSYQDPDRTHVLTVVGSKFVRAAGDASRQRVQREFWRGAHSGSTAIGPDSDRDPGRLGGTLRCAEVAGGGATGRVCLSVDAGAVVVVVDRVRTGEQLDPDLVLTARESMEHRT